MPTVRSLAVAPIPDAHRLCDLSDFPFDAHLTGAHLAPILDAHHRLAPPTVSRCPPSCRSHLPSLRWLGNTCLGHFPVEHQGPALIYLAEDALPRVRERIAALCAHRGLCIQALELYVITAPSLRLDDTTDQARLVATIEAYKPRLLVLDPLVRLHCRDENRADEVSALLGFLRALQRQHQVAIVVVHHMGKKHRRDLGQSLRGSSDLHAWSDSSAYLVRRHDQILLTLEHRSAPAPPQVTLTLSLGPDGKTPHLERVTSTGDLIPPPLAQRIREALQKAAAPLSRSALREQLRINNLRLGQELTALEAQGIVSRTSSGWALTASGGASSL